MPRKRAKIKPDNEILSTFWNAREEAYFNQVTISVITCFSIKTLEAYRWKKTGILFRKVGGRVLYQKKDVVAWLEGHKLIKTKKGK